MQCRQRHERRQCHPDRHEYYLQLESGPDEYGLFRLYWQLSHERCRSRHDESGQLQCQYSKPLCRRSVPLGDRKHRTRQRLVCNRHDQPSQLYPRCVVESQLPDVQCVGSWKSRLFQCPCPSLRIQCCAKSKYANKAANAVSDRAWSDNDDATADAWSGHYDATTDARREH